MSEDEFTKLFKYMEKRFADMDKQFQGLRDEFREFQTSIDALAKRIADDDEERAAMVAQLERHDRWLHELAGKLGTKLSS